MKTDDQMAIWSYTGRFKPRDSEAELETIKGNGRLMLL